MDDRRPGAGFLQRRLERAAAIPPAERPPEVAAFVESVQLLREACDLLPLTDDGRPALQLGSPGTQQQVLLAFLKAARAEYAMMCPVSAVCDRNHQRHLAAYYRELVSCGAGGLQEALRLFLCATSSSQTMAPAEHGRRAARLLAEPAAQEAIGRQLQQLAAAHPQQALLTVEQLRYACCCAGALSTLAMQAMQSGDAQIPLQGLGSAPANSLQGAAARAAANLRPLSAAQQRRAEADKQTCVRTLLQLEPGNPTSLYIAGEAAKWDGQPRRAAQLYLQAIRLAEQQGDVLFAACYATKAMRVAAAAANSAGATSTDHAAWQAALAAYQRAQPALQHRKRLLPTRWVHLQEVAVQQELAHPCVRAMLPAGPSSSARHDEERPANAFELLAALEMCHGCKQRLVGLQRCSRCRKAQYCRCGRDLVCWGGL